MSLIALMTSSASTSAIVSLDAAGAGVAATRPPGGAGEMGGLAQFGGGPFSVSLPRYCSE